MHIKSKPVDSFARQYGARAIRNQPVAAELSYVAPSAVPLFNFMYQPPDGIAQHNCQYENCAVSIADARALAVQPSVHAEGFELWEVPSEVTNFRDDEEVCRIYHEECAALACKVTGGQRAYVFDHLVRKREAGRPPLTFGRHDDGSAPAAAGRVHNDYTEASGSRRLALVLGDEKVERYCVVNIWRSIAGPIVDTPLAICDARTVAATDMQVSEIHYPGRSGEIYLVTYSPRHRWFYYSRMERHEALVFKQYDSQLSGVARYIPHAAFDLPDIPADAPMRESIEARCLVVMS